MKRTGVFATPEELEAMKSACNRPAIALNCGTPRSALQIAHDCALKHDLPEIPGYYGCDLKTGEFLSA